MDVVQTNFELICQTHKDTVEFMQVDNLNENKKYKPLFYCSYCVEQDPSFKMNNYLFIKHIIKSGKDEVLEKWPPVNDNQLLKQLIQITTRKEEIQSIEAEIDQYFTDLKLEILKQIDIFQKKMIQKAEELIPQYKNELLNKYQKLSRINELKSIIMDYKTDIYAKEIQYKKFIESILEQKKSITEQLASLLEMHQNREPIINYSSALIMKEQVLQSICTNFKDMQSKNCNEIQIQNTTNPNELSMKGCKEISNEQNDQYQIIVKKEDKISDIVSQETQQIVQKQHKQKETIWKVIENYPNYLISNQGQVKNKKTNTLLKGSPLHNKSLVVGLFNQEGQKTLPINRLVAKHFLENPYNLSYVKHYNNNNQDNRAQNLYYSSFK